MGIAPYQRSEADQVLSDAGLKALDYFGLPKGPIPGFPDYVATGNMSEGLFKSDGTNGSWPVGVYSYDSGTWKMLSIDANNVHKTGAESIAGIKTFSSSPVIPDATSDHQAAAFGQVMPLTGGTFTGDVQQATAPVNAYSLVNKGYVDNADAMRYFKLDVDVASIANVNISSAPATIDGVSYTRALLKNQTTASQNGIYDYNGTGSALTRSADADTGSELANKTIPVKSGTVNADTWFTVINDSITIGSTAILITQTGGKGTYTNGTGILLDGNIFSIDPAYAIQNGTSAVNQNFNIGTGTGTAAQFRISGAGSFRVSVLGTPTTFADLANANLQFNNAAVTGFTAYNKDGMYKSDNTFRQLFGFANGTQTINSDILLPANNSGNVALTNSTLPLNNNLDLGTGTGTATTFKTGTSNNSLTINQRYIYNNVNINDKISIGDPGINHYTEQGHGFFVDGVLRLSMVHSGAQNTMYGNWAYDGAQFRFINAPTNRSDLSTGSLLLRRTDNGVFETVSGSYFAKATDLADYVPIAGSTNITGAKRFSAANTDFDNLISSSMGGSHRFYNTVDQTTNFERAVLYWDANQFYMATRNGGTGISRDIIISSLGGVVYLEGRMIDLGRSYSSGTSNASFVRQNNTATAVSGVSNFYNMSTTVNQSATAGYNGMLVNVTETATGSGPKRLFAGQIGGVDKFYADNTGGIFSAAVTANTILKADGSKKFVSAVAGTDYVIPSALTFVSTDGNNLSNVRLYNAGLNNLTGTQITYSTNLEPNKPTSVNGFNFHMAADAVIMGEIFLNINNEAYTRVTTSGGTGYGPPLKLLTSSDLSGYAPLAGPAFTGVPTAPTASVGTNTTQLATTAFVNNNFWATNANQSGLTGFKEGVININFLNSNISATQSSSVDFTGLLVTSVGGTASTNFKNNEISYETSLNITTVSFNTPTGTRNQFFPDASGALNVINGGTAPATSTSSGKAGTIRYDSNYIYYCVADNTWLRGAISSTF